MEGHMLWRSEVIIGIRAGKCRKYICYPIEYTIFNSPLGTLLTPFHHRSRFIELYEYILTACACGSASSWRACAASRGERQRSAASRSPARPPARAPPPPHHASLGIWGQYIDILKSPRCTLNVSKKSQHATGVSLNLLCVTQKFLNFLQNF